MHKIIFYKAAYTLLKCTMKLPSKLSVKLPMAATLAALALAALGQNTTIPICVTLLAVAKARTGPVTAARGFVEQMLKILVLLNGIAHFLIVL
jgi:hypothetical protein